MRHDGLKKHYYVVQLSSGGLLCKDGKYRTFAGFGTFESCVKMYRQEGWAARAVDLRNSFGDTPRAAMLTLQRNQYLDAAGIVYEEDESGNGRKLGTALELAR